MNSDVTIGEGASAPARRADGGSILFLAPNRGSNELWRIATDDGALERLTDDRHYLSSFDAVEAARGGRPAHRGDPLDRRRAARRSWSSSRRRSDARRRRLSARVDRQPERAPSRARSSFAPPIERWAEVDGQQVQGWLIPAGDGPKPTVLEIHGGPHTLYGWSPSWEFQILAGAGISVAYANPRGSEGYGLEFNEANIDDWGDGPMRDVLGMRRRASSRTGSLDPDRLGVTGGSYGGYLTSWIVGHDQRFKAAMSARSVNDLAMRVHDRRPRRHRVAEPGVRRLDLGRSGDVPLASPLTYADAVRTPLLIQHSEQDLRTPIDQGEMFFNRLRRLRRPGPADARPRGEPRADPLRHAVPAGREPGPGARLVPALPRRRPRGPCRRPRGPATAAEASAPPGSTKSRCILTVPWPSASPTPSPASAPASSSVRGRVAARARWAASSGARPRSTRSASRLRVESLKKRSIKKASKLWALDLAIRMMDLTTLEGRDTPGKIRALCAKAIHPMPGDPTIPSVAAICLYPTLIAEAKEALRGSSVKVASVATGFPSGQTFRSIKIAEVREAVAAGADEIDMVIDRGAFLSGDYPTVFDEIVDDQGRLRRGAPQGHPRDRRARDVRPGPAREHPRDGRGRRLHQDLDRQGPARGDAARDARHARGHPRLREGDRPGRRDEAGRRHPDRQGGDPVPRRAVRDARPALDDPGALPVRRVERCSTTS